MFRDSTECPMKMRLISIAYLMPLTSMAQATSLERQQAAAYKVAYTFDTAFYTGIAFATTRSTSILLVPAHSRWTCIEFGTIAGPVTVGIRSYNYPETAQRPSVRVTGNTAAIVRVEL
ncbi:hypothetical protein BKA64DRAFT_679255 [Cadophora sp. MPI-SDFR-AT-0126]|nr:hypothetical protein BKA64DRAFT_679255 [Leotiomycetes sp. MPI-SDFR-AT-0126]